MGKEIGLRMKHTLRPRHAEEFSLRESDQFAPWEVMMLVQPEQIDPRTYSTFYYVRAPSPGAAATAANAYWTRWEKEEKGLGHKPYPDTIEQAGVTRLREDMWEEFWKEAQTYPHRFVGMKDNPSGFTFWKPGYGEEDGRRFPHKSSIIVPDLKF